MPGWVLVVLIAAAAVILLLAVARRNRPRRIGFRENEAARAHWREEHADRHHPGRARSSAAEGGPWGPSRAAEASPQRRPAGHAGLSGADMAEIEDQLRRGNKIAAIKLVRERTGLGLKQAKDFVEGLPSGRGR